MAAEQQQFEVEDETDDTPEFVKLAAGQLAIVRASIDKSVRDGVMEPTVERAARLGLADRYIKVAEVQAAYETSFGEDRLIEVEERLAAIEGDGEE